MVALQPHVTFDRAASDLMLEQTRILSCNPVPKRGLPGAIVNHAAGWWHIVVVQASVEFLQLEDITRQFFVTHLVECAALFNKHAFHQDIVVKAVHIQADKSINCSGWAFEAVVSECSCKEAQHRAALFACSWSFHATGGRRHGCW